MKYTLELSISRSRTDLWRLFDDPNNRAGNPDVLVHLTSHLGASDALPGAILAVAAA